MLMYRFMVQAIVLYNLESEHIAEAHMSRSYVFFMSILRKICGLSWKKCGYNIGTWYRERYC